jgi:hypothetical protein
MPEEQDIPKQPSNENKSADVIMQSSLVSPSEIQPTDMEVSLLVNETKKRVDNILT